MKLPTDWMFARRTELNAEPVTVAIPEAAPSVRVDAEADDRETLKRLLSLTNELGQPNLNELLIRLRNLDALALSVKALGYQVARELSSSLAAAPVGPAETVGIGSKLCTQADIQSGWARHWFSELKVVPIMHRKLWEFAYALQALHDAGMLNQGRRGLGFGCGKEPLASYFAARGLDIVTSDLPPDDARARLDAKQRIRARAR